MIRGVTTALIPVHPHACGEHVHHTGDVLKNLGSSPRLWGTRSSGSLESRDMRFIPTPVGNTIATSVHRTAQSVHPHACGEHKSRIQASSLTRGSSPRLWGTPPIRTNKVCDKRFIPTPVGNTQRFWLPARPPTVHPHACGEHLRPL
ncbi:hypothetical protein D1AOALGA4SA_11485 [Olavius algarvensis Delta 1 endosymbiont]|nr:hypothetical protein D1AOALGA4SA_11485 [Olavius algarvensis Delta 1 endosymbiont]